jgi:hypothetical protein
MITTAMQMLIVLIWCHHIDVYVNQDILEMELIVKWMQYGVIGQLGLHVHKHVILVKE